MFIGLGSNFGDDRVGWDVVTQLQQAIPTLECYCCERPGLLTNLLLNTAHNIIVIDAMVTGAPLGTIHCIQHDEIYTQATKYSTHALNLADALAISQILSPKIITIYGIEITPPSIDAPTTQYSSPLITQAINSILLEFGQTAI